MELEHAPGRDEETEALREARAARLQSAAHLLEFYLMVDCERTITNIAHAGQRHAQDLAAGRRSDGTQRVERVPSMSSSSSSSTSTSICTEDEASASRMPRVDEPKHVACLDDRHFVFGAGADVDDIFGPSRASDLV